MCRFTGHVETYQARTALYLARGVIWRPTRPELGLDFLPKEVFQLQKDVVHLPDICAECLGKSCWNTEGKEKPPWLPQTSLVRSFRTQKVKLPARCAHLAQAPWVLEASPKWIVAARRWFLGQEWESRAQLYPIILHPWSMRYWYYMILQLFSLFIFNLSSNFSSSFSLLD